MIRNILAVCTGLVVLAAVGCAENQSVISALPDPLVRSDASFRAPVTPVVPSRPLMARPYQPYRPLWQAVPVRTASIGEPGWIPSVGLSNRWTCLVIHHSASDRGTPESMDQSHRQRGWDELGYHFVIGNGIGYPDGKVYIGSRWEKQKHGAHCKVPGNYYNEHGVGICLMGNLEDHPPTDRQMQALAQLVTFLEGQCSFSYDRVLTHGGITGKTRCPGRYFSINDLYRRINAPMYASRK
jgi:hypothetical protein